MWWEGECSNRFTDVTGTVVIASNLDDSKVEVSTIMASVESGSAERDAHIKSAELFDVAQFPTATFRGTRLTGAEQAAPFTATSPCTE